MSEKKEEDTKYVYLNECSYEVCVYTGSKDNKHTVKPGESIVVEIPSGAIPVIKTWDDGILLSCVKAESYND